MSLRIEPRLAELERLCRRYHVQRLALFGSAVGDDFDPARSDIDFLVAFQPLGEGSRADAYFGFKESLESLFGRPVDLVVDDAIRNPYFRKSVDESTVLVYAA